MINLKRNKEEGIVGCFVHVDHDRNCTDFDLLTPLEIKGVKLRNRIVLSPMCQYSAQDGLANDWHLVHLGSRAVGGAGLVFVEATAVTAQGRITPSDMGIWEDKHIAPLARIAHFIEEVGAVPAIQLAHAGRKGSCTVPWQGGNSLMEEQSGWKVVAPSSIPFSSNNPVPEALSKKEIFEIVEAFKKAALRSIEAGFKILEIHSAHGYLLHEFLSPLSNKREDEYGGSLENRMRFLMQIIEEVRALMPNTMPLFVRISATDWVEGGWDIKQSTLLAKHLKLLGVDLIDVSSGALLPHVKIPIERNYQVPFAEVIRSQAEVMTGAVGLITDPHQANEIITSGKADLVFIAREFLREPYWGLKAEQALHQEPAWPIPYGYAVKRHH
jgi:2,4-dienoyl-CoA reductase (NADPH2)